MSNELTWLRETIKKVPTRTEPIGGQQQRYVALDEVLGWIDVAEGRSAAQQAEPVNAQLSGAMNALDTVIGCFAAALCEGLSDALAETQDARLKDLVERRLMHALYAAQRVSTGSEAKRVDPVRLTEPDVWNDKSIMSLNGTVLQMPMSNLMLVVGVIETAVLRANGLLPNEVTS